MHRSRMAALMVLFCALFAGSLLVPPSAGATAPPELFDVCQSIGMRISYVDPIDGPTEIWNHPSEKFAVPILTPLEVKINVAPSLYGKEVRFRANNPWTAVATNSVKEGGVVTGQPYLLTPPSKVNFLINWPGSATNDGYIIFRMGLTTPGKLSTIGATVAGGRCSAKIELVGYDQET
ncbi:MAG: hypothetical protein IT340_13450 [Chloroflexi bacterium]|nr:hypothetical protein [Chloroflexota bacterium]